MSFVLFLIPSTLVYFALYCLIISADFSISTLGRTIFAYASVSLMSLSIISFRGIWKAWYDDDKDGDQ